MSPERFRLRELGEVAGPISLLISSVIAFHLLTQQPQVDTNTKNIQTNRKDIKSIAPQARAVAKNTALTEARKTRTIFLRQSRTLTKTIVKKELGQQGRKGSTGTAGRNVSPDELVAALVDIMPAALNDYCGTHVCDFPVTSEQVAAALESFCSHGGKCVISQDEIDAAIKSYCEGPMKPCKGDKGNDGKDGSIGPAGPAPAGWTWTWTDQTGILHSYACGDPDGDLTYTCIESPMALPPAPPPPPEPLPAPVP
jgi:hypothetical protein